MGTWFSRITESVARAFGEGVARVKSGSFREQFGAAGGDFRDLDEDEFRPVSQRPIRDLSALKREQQLKLVYQAYLSNPLAFRSVEITKDYVIGDGLTFKARDGRVQEVLDNFWHDPVNRWDMKQFTRVMELGLYGEQFYTVKVSEQNGRVRMGYLDPLQVTDVLTDPLNVEIPRKVVVGRQDATGSDTAPQSDGPEADKKLDVIGPDEDPKSETFGMLRGEVFFFAINKVSNAVRGNSDLLASLDWLDTLDNFLWGIHEAAIQKSKVIWDVLVKGASDKDLDDLEKKYGNVKSGAVRIHNENVVTTTVAPTLQSPELAEHARLIKNHIASGVGLPPHWIAESGDANRATAAEMGIPVVKRLRARQVQFRSMVSFIFQFVIDQAIIAKRLPPDVDKHFIIMLPQIWAIDTQTTTQSLVNATTALQSAVENGWVEDDEASDLWRFIATQLGMSISSDALEGLARPKGSESQADSQEQDFTRAHADKVAELGRKLEQLNGRKREQQTPAPSVHAES